ncbi:MAG: hypothetical protein KDK78_08130 [Chlamydiia bacterium]|nr:hypothetical protein [Chlamydiia bacterium]
MSSPERVRQLHKQLARVEQALVEREKLEHQRQEIETKYEALKEELHEGIRRLHSFKDPHSTERKELAEKTERLQLQVSELSGIKGDIDHQLDNLEEDFEALQQQLRGHLVAEIIELHPNARPSWEAIQQSMKEIGEGHAHIRKGIDALQEVLTPMQTAMEARRTQRRRGLMNIIFGRNPTVVIAGYLDKAHQAAKSGYALNFEQRPAHLRTHHSAVNLSGLHEIFFKITQACEARDALKTLDTVFASLTKETEAMYETLQLDLAMVEGELDEIEAETRDWMQRYTDQVQA